MSGNAPTDNSGSDRDPTATAEQVLEQMREATDRIRDKAWMVASMTASVDLAADDQEPATP